VLYVILVVVRRWELFAFDAEFQGLKLIDLVLFVLFFPFSNVAIVVLRLLMLCLTTNNPNYPATLRVRG